MVLTCVKPCVLFMFRIEHLQFTHRSVRRVTIAGRTNGQSVVSTGGKLEFQSDNKVVVFFLCQQLPAMAGFAPDSAVDNFIILPKRPASRLDPCR